MSHKNRRSRRLWIAAAIFTFVAGLTVFMFGQQHGRIVAPNSGMNVPILSHGPQQEFELQGLPDDWSFHHLNFTDPGTEEEATKVGAHEEWLRVVNNPRYVIQQLRRRQPARGPWAQYVDRMNATALSNGRAVGVDSNSGQGQDAAQSLRASPPARNRGSISRDWSMALNGAAASFTASVAAPASGNITSSSTLAVDGVTFHASPPVAEVATISVGTANYCIPPGAGFTVGTTPTNVTTNGTAPSGGSITITSGNGTSGLSVTVGGVTYTYESSVTASGCGTTLNCLLGGQTGGAGHDADAEALYRAVNNSGSCTDNGTQTCYKLITGQGANAAATASHTASTNVTSISTWKCAGTAASLWSTSGCGSETCTAATGGSAGTSPNIIMPSTMLAANLASAINTAIAAQAPAGLTSGLSGSTVTLTATAAGSTGISDALDGSVTGATVAVTTTGSNGTTSGTSSPPTFAYWSGSTYADQSTLASNIASAINANTTLKTVSTGVSAASNSNTGNNLTITARTAGTGGNSYAVAASSDFTAFTPASGNLSGGTAAATALAAGQYPAKYGFSTTSATCSDFVIYPTGAAGASSAATIMAYINLYGTNGGSPTGCGTSAAVPSVYWAYNAPVGSTYGTATLSPIFDSSGAQVAFVETVGSTAYLVLLRMPSTSSSNWSNRVTTPTYEANSSYLGCSAPCYTYLSLGTTDSNSPPFYDFSTDAIYVGDDAGYVHQFLTVFNGTPSTGWTIKVTGSETSTHLTGAVIDPNSPGYIYVADNNGYLHSIDTSGGTLATSSRLDAEGGFADSPLIDSTSTASGSTSYVYTFGQYSSSVTYINQFSDSSSIGSGYGTRLRIGSNASSSLSVYDGAFDYQHTAYNNGNLYFCALSSSSTNEYPTLYQIALNGSTNLSTTGTHAPIVTAYNSVAKGAATCSPVTEFYNNGGTTAYDYLYLSVTANGNQTGTGACTSACLYSFSVPLTGSGTAGSILDGLSVTSGASGVIIDNLVPSTSQAGASNVYFAPLGSQSCAGNGTTGSGTGGCGVQATQSSLSQ